MFMLTFNQDSTVFRSLIFLSSSSTDIGGATIPGMFILPHRFLINPSGSPIEFVPDASLPENGLLIKILLNIGWPYDYFWGYSCAVLLVSLHYLLILHELGNAVNRESKKASVLKP